MNPNIAEVLKDVQRALEEDIGSGDVSAELLAKDTLISAQIISREPMLMCGQAWALETFKALDASVVCEWHVREGAWLSEPTTLCDIKGSARAILTAERSALNFLQTLSATATKTHQYLELLQGTQTRLLDTRKTLPGLRYAQKYAVSCAGGENHRFGLYDAFLIKENHIHACGSITHAIKEARRQHPQLFLDVEVENLDELQEALTAKPDRILLDNFSLEMLKKAVLLNNPKVCPLEVSGGVNASTIRDIALVGVDYISVGALTKSIQAIDLSLLVRDIL